LPRNFASLLRGTLTPSQAFHLAVRIGRRATARLPGTMYLPQIVRRAIPDTALDVAILVAHRATTLLGAEDLSVSIYRALTFPAHHGAILVPDAVRGVGARGRKQHKATNEEARSILHRMTFELQFVERAAQSDDRARGRCLRSRHFFQ